MYWNDVSWTDAGLLVCVYMQVKRSRLSLRNFNNGPELENAVRNYTYPGRLYCKVIFTHPSHQRERLADVVLQFEGANPVDLNFPLEFYGECDASVL